MKAITQALIPALVIFAVYGFGGAASAQAPTVTVLVKPSPTPIPLTVVRGTLVVFQGTISQQMMMTTFALRNDYGEFTKGDFLDSWKLVWNTAIEHDPTEQIAVYWSRGGGAVTRMTRYNVKLIDAVPFTMKVETIVGKTSVTITPTGALTAQKFTLSLDGAPTPLTVDGSGKVTIDTSLFRPGDHTLGASALMADGSVTALTPVTFLVSPVSHTKPHKPAASVTAKRKPAHPAKTHGS